MDKIYSTAEDLNTNMFFFHSRRPNPHVKAPQSILQNNKLILLFWLEKSLNRITRPTSSAKSEVKQAFRLFIKEQ